jgi:hypothetical protein
VIQKNIGFNRADRNLFGVLFIGCVLVIFTGFLSGCSAEDISNSTDRDNAQTIHLVRKFQMVQRIDCSGSEISNKMETVSSPTDWVEIRPRYLTDFESVEFKNLTHPTNYSTRQGSTKFQVDASYGFLNVHVKPGINQIQYDFYKCYKWVTETATDGSTYTRCIDSRSAELGSVYVNITYEETTLSGTVSYKPTIEECAEKRSW